MSWKKHATEYVFKILKPKPSVGDKSLSELKIAVQKTKGSAAKLKQTLWESKRKKREERFTFDKRNTRTKTSDEKRYEEAQIKKD